MKNKALILTGTTILLMVAAAAAIAGDATTTTATAAQSTDIIDSFAKGSKGINSTLINAGLTTAAAALTLQWIITYYKEIFNGDMTSALAKSVGLVSWFGITATLLNHQELLSNAFQGYLTLAVSITGTSATDFTPMSVVDMAADIISSNYAAVWKDASSKGLLELGDSFLLSIELVVVSVIIFGSFTMLALSLLMTMLEFWMVFAVAPLAFGLIPLSAFRDQGVAPIKGVMSLGLRVVILAVIIGVAKNTSADFQALLAAPDHAGLNLFGKPMLRYLFSMLGVGAMSIASGKIAAAISSGSASFSGSDAVRSATSVATTAAAAGAVVAGGVGVAALAGRGAMAGVEKAAAQHAARSAASVMPSSSSSGPMSNLGQPLPSPSNAPQGGQSAGSSQAPSSPHSADAGSHTGSSKSSSSFGSDMSSPPPSSAPTSEAAPTGNAEKQSPSAASHQTASSGASNPSASQQTATNGLGADMSSNSTSSSIPPAGDGSTAGIGAAPQTPMEKRLDDLANAMNKGPTKMQRLGQTMHQAAQEHTQDQHSVSVQLNTRGE